MKIFLGGTCNESKWRNSLVKILDNDIEAFDPVVKDWNEESYQRELVERNIYSHPWKYLII